MLVNFEAISSKWFNNLPPDYQKILVEECDKAGIETSKLIMDKLEKEVKADLTKKRGMIVVDKVDIPAFKRAGERKNTSCQRCHPWRKGCPQLGKVRPVQEKRGR